jgi:repressor of nif and glnA expression
MTYRMSFDLSRRTGTVVVNVSIVKKDDLQKFIAPVQETFRAGYGMGRLVTLFAPGSKLDGTAIPQGLVGLGTVCSITLNGVLLINGIPTYSKFGGLLEVHEGKPVRFVEIIHYDGTTLDPLEIFIRGHMTDCLGAAKAGDGRIGASFRELPAESRDDVIELAGELDKAGLGGFLVIGWPGQPVLEIPVNHGRVGAIVIGGLNPASVLEEKGVTTQSRALATLAEYESFFHYEELADRLQMIG